MGCFGRRDLHERTNSEETQPLLRILERPHEISHRKHLHSVRRLEGLRVLEYQFSFTELSHCRRYTPVTSTHGIRSSDCRRGRAMAGRIAHRAILASSREGGVMSLTAAALICSFSSNAVGASKNCTPILICTGVRAALLAPPGAPAPVLPGRSANLGSTDRPTREPQDPFATGLPIIWSPVESRVTRRHGTRTTPPPVVPRPWPRGALVQR
jgi:hypothetical protein